MTFDASNASPYPGRNRFDLHLYVRNDGTDAANNRSKYAWELRARNTDDSSLTYVLDCLNWHVVINGRHSTSCHNLDFRGGQDYLILGSGATSWFDHDSSGNLHIKVDASHGGSIFGVAGVTVHMDADRIVRPPSAPTSPVVSRVTPTSARVTFALGANNGGAITSNQFQWSKSSSFSSLVWTDEWSGNLTEPPGADGVILDPGTRYFVRARSYNAAGWGSWSTAIATVDTLPSTAPSVVATPSISGTQATIVVFPPGGISGVDKYKVEWRKAGVSTLTGTIIFVTSPQTISNLIPGVEYQYRVQALIGNYTTPWSAWTGVTQPAPNANIGSYYDGDFADRADATFAWTSTPNASTTEISGVAPEGWMTFDDSSVESGGAGVVQRATGGISDGFAARVLFFADTTTDGYRAGTAVNVDVEEGQMYWGSIHATPEARTQRLAAEISWYEEGVDAETPGPLISRSIGESKMVLAGDRPRLVVNDYAPEDAQWASVAAVDVLGTGWSKWLGGDALSLDRAMISLGNLYPWFSGSLTDTAEYEYEWLGPVNASVSKRTSNPVSTEDPLADPDCLPVPLPPRPPDILDDCIEDVGVWRRYYAVIPASEVSAFLSTLPTLGLTTGGLAARQVRIRMYQNPFGYPVEQVDTSSYCSEQIISYIPPYTTLTIDGELERVFATVPGGSSVAADHLLYGTDGAPASWPELSCSVDYLVSIDVPLDTPAGNLTTAVSLTRRS